MLPMMLVYFKFNTCFAKIMKFPTTGGVVIVIWRSVPGGRYTKLSTPWGDVLSSPASLQRNCKLFYILMKQQIQQPSYSAFLIDRKIQEGRLQKASLSNTSAETHQHLLEEPLSDLPMEYVLILVIYRSLGFQITLSHR